MSNNATLLIPEIATIRRPRLARATTVAGDRGAASFLLTVVEGPDAGFVVTIDAHAPTRVLLGQSPACLIRMTDPAISRRHAAFSLVDAKLVVVDLGSTNGTSVNGVHVREASLYGGEALRVGSSVLSIRRGEARGCSSDIERQQQRSAFGRVAGTSRAMKRLYPTLAQLALGDRPVLIEGEAGTGKELIAEELHRASRRNEGPFIALEASTIAAEKLGEALFGSSGLLQQARGGVLFIDEIGNLPRPAQALLRDHVRRAMPTNECDVRLIAATRRDLDRDVAQGRFDDELFFLLAAGRIELAPLREREGDVAFLASHFWRELADTGFHGEEATLPVDFLPRFEDYRWPGNVRELRSAVLARMTMGELCQARRVVDEDNDGPTGDYLRALLAQDLPFPVARERMAAEFKRRYVERVLQLHNGNVTQAARASGVAHRYFQSVKAQIGK